MFPLRLLLLLMAGNAPAPAMRLSIAPLPALNPPPLPPHHYAPIHLETLGKEYCLDPSLSGKEKNPMTTFLLNHFQGRHPAWKITCLSYMTHTAPQNNPTVMPEPCKGEIFWGFCFPVTIQQFLPKMRSFLVPILITQGWASAFVLMPHLQQTSL